jgi:hypothetical protein
MDQWEAVAFGRMWEVRKWRFLLDSRSLEYGSVRMGCRDICKICVQWIVIAFGRQGGWLNWNDNKGNQSIT